MLSPRGVNTTTDGEAHIFEIGSTEIAHEMESNLPTKFQAIEHIRTISELDADPPRKRPDV